MPKTCESCGNKELVLFELDSGQWVCPSCYKEMTGKLVKPKSQSSPFSESIHPTDGEYMTSTLLGFIIVIAGLMSLGSMEKGNGWWPLIAALIAGGVLAVINTRVEIRRQRVETIYALRSLENALREMKDCGKDS